MANISANPLCFLSTENVRNVTLCNYNYSHEGIFHPDRIMNEYDMLFLTNGNWDIYEDDNLYHVSSGQILLLEPGKHHYSLTKCSPEMRNMFLHLSVLPGDGQYSDTALSIAKLTDCNPRPDIPRLFDEIIDLYWSAPNGLKSFRMQTLLSSLLIELSDLAKTPVKSIDSEISDILSRFRSNPDIFYSPEELAYEYGMSLRTLSSHFKVQTGTTVHQYQLNLKLDRAYDALIQNPTRSIKDLAVSYGFYDEFHFSKLFKRKFGISPSLINKPVR